MSKLLVLALFVTATGGCATGADDEVWLPPAAHSGSDRIDVLSGADIPSTLVSSNRFYAASRHLDEIDVGLSADKAAYAHALDGIIVDLANGKLDAAELVEAERDVDFDEERAELAALWALLATNY